MPDAIFAVAASLPFQYGRFVNNANKTDSLHGVFQLGTLVPISVSMYYSKITVLKYRYLGFWKECCYILLVFKNVSIKFVAGRQISNETLG